MISAFAPGRMELIGNHTNYNEGFVLAFAIQFGITIHGEARSDDTIVLHSPEFGEDKFSIQHIQKNVHAPWSNYMKGVLLELQNMGAPLGGFDAEITSTLPSGVGLSSIGAIEVATILFVQKLFPFTFGNMEDASVRMGLAQMCRKAENDFVDIHCGILDQATSLMGRKDHAVFIDCRFDSVETIPIPPEMCFVVCDTGVTQMLLSSKYNARRSECEEAVRLLQLNGQEIKALRDITPKKLQEKSGLFSPRVFQRGMHIASENERVLQAREALLQHDVEKLGQLMYESHESSCHAFENSTSYLDMLVNIAKTLPACVGSRLTGGGFGGATLSMVRRECAEGFVNELTSLYRAQSSKEPKAYILDAADGAA